MSVCLCVCFKLSRADLSHQGANHHDHSGGIMILGGPGFLAVALRRAAGGPCGPPASCAAPTRCFCRAPHRWGSASVSQSESLSVCLVGIGRCGQAASEHYWYGHWQVTVRTAPRTSLTPNADSDPQPAVPCHPYDGYLDFSRYTFPNICFNLTSSGFSSCSVPL